jgi:hypothetical protein
MPNMQDQKGRSRRRNPIGEQFAARTIAMLESPAYRVLSRAALFALSRLEVELAHHGGHDNGELPCTFDDFVGYGVHRHSIAPALRELVALGFVQIMRHGCALNGDQRQSNLYRLTYQPTKNGGPTHDWRRIKMLDEAQRMALQARREGDPRARALGRARVRKQKASGSFCRAPVSKIGTETPQLPVTKTVTTGVAKSVTPI